MGPCGVNCGLLTKRVFVFENDIKYLKTRCNRFNDALGNNKRRVLLFFISKLFFRDLITNTKF